MAAKAKKTAKKHGLKKQGKVVSKKQAKGHSKATVAKKQAKKATAVSHYKSCKVDDTGCLTVNGKKELICQGRLIFTYDSGSKDTQKLFTDLATKAKKKNLTVKQYLRLAIAKA